MLNPKNPIQGVRQNCFFFSQTMQVVLFKVQVHEVIIYLLTATSRLQAKLIARFANLFSHSSSNTLNWKIYWVDCGRLTLVHAPYLFLNYFPLVTHLCCSEISNSQYTFQQDNGPKQFSKLSQNYLEFRKLWLDRLPILPYIPLHYYQMNCIGDFEEKMQIGSEILHCLNNACHVLPSTIFSKTFRKFANNSWSSN